MKHPAFLLIILMLFFMAQPVLINCQAQIAPVSKMAGCCGGKICHKKNADKAPVKDCDRTNACNPFAGCSQCQYVGAAKFLYRSYPVFTIEEKIETANENILAGYRNECWHPPKCISV